jgi:tetratricopeptide (TPR) repeat protein
MKLTVAFLVFSPLLSGLLSAQTSPPPAADTPEQIASAAETAIEQAYFRNSDHEIEKAAKPVASALARHSGSGPLLYMEGFAAFARGTCCRFSNDRDGAQEWLERADRSLKKVRGGRWEAEADAFDACVLTQLIGIEGGANAEDLGSDSGVRLRFANKVLPHSPRVLLFSGLCRWLTPAAYGGDSAAGLKLLQASVAAFSAEQKESAATGGGPRWGRAYALGWLGTALKRQGDLAGARLAWREALEAAPNYWYVKTRLLPSVSR